jgi:hypothetical protein
MFSFCCFIQHAEVLIPTKTKKCFFFLVILDFHIWASVDSLDLVHMYGVKNQDIFVQLRLKLNSFIVYI